MAYRKVRTEEEEVLRKVSKEVKQFDEALWSLLDDMADTMYEENGVGLAAPQVGILKRIFVIDIGEGLIEFINPTVIATEGEQFGEEGCLSVPGKQGTVTRPNYVKAKAYDMDMNEFIVEGEELMARAICHELAHLDGDLYIDHVEDELLDVEELEDFEDEE